MSGWKDELAGLAAVGERLAGQPTPEDVQRRVRRRTAARLAVPVGAAALVIAAGALVVPGLFRHSLEAAAPAADACGLPFLEAAAATFGVEEAVGPGEGLADVVAGANQVVERGSGIAIGVGVRYGASGIEQLALFPTVDDDYVAAWLVSGGEVVGVLEPEFVGAPEGNVEPGGELWLDGSYVPHSCDGAPAAVGEYTVVTAVALAPVLDGSHDPGTATAVLSEPIPLRIDEPDPLAGLGACGSTWPDDVVETTDGYALGLRIDSGATGLEVTSGGALETDVTASNEGAEDLVGWTGHPHLVIVADGTVVGETDATTDEGLDATLAPGASLDYRGYLPLTWCGTSEHLEPGTYEVYAIMSFFFDSPAGQDGPEGNRTDVTAVGGPWEITIE